MAFSGARVRKAANETGANYSAGTNVPWDTEVFDEGGWFDTGVSTVAFTIPSGVSRVRCGASIRTASVGTTDWLVIQLRKNGSATFNGAAGTEVGGTNLGTATGNRCFCSGPIDCSPGDTFSVFFQVQADTSIDITATQSNFWIEKVA